MADDTTLPSTYEASIVLVIVVKGGEVRLEIDDAGIDTASASMSGGVHTTRLLSNETVAPGVDPRVSIAIAAVAADPVGDHTGAALARRMGVSIRHLTRLFVDHVGMTPARYVERVRLAIARELLTTTDTTLASVASQAGFGSAETMRRAFVRADGSPPGAYRARPPAVDGEAADEHSEEPGHER